MLMYANSVLDKIFGKGRHAYMLQCARKRKRA